MTAIAHRLAWDPVVRTSLAAARLVSSLHDYLRSLVCGLFGHDRLLHFEAERLSLLCVRCGAQTCGWKIDVNPAFRRKTGTTVAAIPSQRGGSVLAFPATVRPGP